MKKLYQSQPGFLPLFKIDLKMRLTLLCLILPFLGMHAHNSYAQKVVTLNYNKTTVSHVLEEIESRTDYRFVYKVSDIDLDKEVKVKAHKEKVSEVLNKIFKNTDVDYDFFDDQVFLAKKNNTVSLNTVQDKIKVTGTVTDNNGVPLPGVNITVKGSSEGTTTDFDGNYEIEVEKGEVLKFSSVGFADQEITVGDDDTIDVTMKEGSALDEVVVVGYGEQSKAKNIGAISSINNKSLNEINALTFEDKLAGKLAGVQINQTNGQPGEGSEIRIRGTGTLTAGTNPLIVLDGYPLPEGTSLNAINPYDIEDVDILKDAASAAIYGSRASNGVLMVTTKKGEKGRTNVNVNVNFGVQKEDIGMNLVDAYDFAVYENEARDYAYVARDPENRSANDPNAVRVNQKINGQSIDGRELHLDELDAYIEGEPNLTNTNWKNEIFRTAPTQNYNISMSGGSDKTQFYSSLGYFDQDGILRGTDMRRFTSNFSLKHEISNRFKAGINYNVSYTRQNLRDQSTFDGGPLKMLPLVQPIYSPFDSDGNLTNGEIIHDQTRKIEGVSINGTPVPNPRTTSEQYKNHRLNFRNIANGFMEAKIIDGLKYRFMAGFDFNAYDKEWYKPQSTDTYRTAVPRSDSNGDEVRNSNLAYDLENTLTYDFNLDKHSFNLLAGYSFARQDKNNTKIAGKGFSDDNLKNIAGASEFDLSDKTKETWTIISYFGRLIYDFDDRYLLSTAIRRDGSSRFGENNRWGVFPSVSGGWILSEEDFFPQMDFFSFAKVSISWGKTGNSQIGNYGSIGLVTNSNYVINGELAPGYITTSPDNSALGWEVSSSLNFGLNLGLFKNKMNIDVAYYRKKTKDLLLNVPTPMQTGYSEVLANYGKMQNKGFEFQLSGNNFDFGEFKIGFDANFSTYKNKVLALGPDQDEIATGYNDMFVTKVGDHVADIRGFDIEGVYKSQDEIDNSPHPEGTILGEYKIKDVNGDGKIDDDDKISKGTYEPDFTYGFGGNISYRNFTFSFHFNGVYGRTLVNFNELEGTHSTGWAVPDQYQFDHRYHPKDNPDGFLKQPNFGAAGTSVNTTSSAVAQKNNANYFRLRDIRIAFNLPKVLLESWNSISDVQIYISGNNVFTNTDYRAYNPEGTSSNILESGYTDSNYPIARKFIIGLDINF